MKRSGYLIVFLLVAVMITGCTGGGWVSGPGSIEGYVRYTGTQEPVGGAFIEIGGRFDRTTSNGWFQMSGIPSGTHTLYVSHPGIQNGEHSQMVKIPANDKIQVTVRVAPVSLPPTTGEVRGWIYVPIGSLMSVASLEVEPLISSQLSPPTGYEPLRGATVRVAGQNKLTASDGGFHFAGISEGYYILTVSHDSLRFPTEQEIYVRKGETTWLGGGTDPLFGGIGYYVVIGVDKYGTDPALPGPRDDAIDVYDALFRGNKLAGLGRLLIRGYHPDAVGEPTKKNIRLSIKEAVETAKSQVDYQNENNYLVIYFSGRSGRDYLKPSNGSPTGWGANDITDVELEQWVSEFPGHVTLIIDGSESETMADDNVLEPLALRQTRYTVLAGAKKDQDAWHDENLGDGRNSVFTHFLLEGITKRYADLNNNRDITARELWLYTDEEMYWYDREHGGPIQVPHFHEGFYGDTVIYRY